MKNTKNQLFLSRIKKIENNFFWSLASGIFLLVLLRGAVSAPPDSLAAPHKFLRVEKAGVASASILASRVGTDIMKQGGNAADAATAVAMALAVVYPQAGNLGGGGFLIYRPGEGGRPYVLDFRETAPAAASADMYLNPDGQPDARKSQLGALAVGVPGTVRGFYRFHRRFGKLSWRRVLEPAIRLAENGFPVDAHLRNVIRSKQKDLRRFPSTAAIFLPDGKLPEVGARLVQKDLARSLRTLALHGDRPFYQGEIARRIVASVKENGGIISLADLKNYRAVERLPLTIDYRGYTIYAVPPPSSGGVVMKGILQSLQRTNPADYPLHSARQIALLAELEKRYFALRNQFLGDPDFVQMPLKRLLSPRLAAALLADIDIRHPRPSAEINPENLITLESNETTHFSVLDPQENAVSVTYTLNGLFGSKLVAAGTGILLNNEMDDFTAKPGASNQFGLVQGKANSIAPGKRMLSSMCPVVVVRGRQLMGLWGSPGGPTIITSVLQVALHLIDYRLPLPRAIAVGRFHHQWLPDQIDIEESKFDPSVLKTLKQWGYPLVKTDHLGDVQAIWRLPDGWQLASDPRGNGYPAGF